MKKLVDEPGVGNQVGAKDSRDHRSLTVPARPRSQHLARLSERLAWAGSPIALGFYLPLIIMVGLVCLGVTCSREPKPSSATLAGQNVGEYTFFNIPDRSAILTEEADSVSIHPLPSGAILGIPTALLEDKSDDRRQPD